MEFLAPVPTVWDETKVLDAKMGDYAVIALRKGREWYIGALTDWTARTLDLDFSFLPEGNFQMDSYEDGPNADRRGNDYQKRKVAVNKNTRLKINMAGGGGWAARISVKK